MQNTSDIYKALLNKADRAVKTRLTIGGEVYTGPILDLSTNGGLFAGQTPSVGCCVSREIYLTIVPDFTIPRMAEIKVEIQLVIPDLLTGAILESSEWLPKGTFFIDTRRTDTASGALVIHGYDAMLKAEEQYIPKGSESTSWPRKMPDVVADICFRMGVGLDARSVINDWDVQYPGDFTMREILGYIAACHVGNWTITDDNKLRLVPLTGSNDRQDIGNKAVDLSVSPEFEAFGGVVFYYDDKDTFSAMQDPTGDGAGVILESSDGYMLQDSDGVYLSPVDGGGTMGARTIEIETPWATQEIADAALNAIGGYVYQPYEAAGALLDPAMELGDTVTVGGVTSVVATIATDFDAMCAADISAPSDEEVDHEYPYEDRSRRQTRREVAKATASLKVGVDEIEARVEGVEGNVSSVTQKVDSIKMEVKSSTGADGQTYASITLRVGDEMYTGQILLDGNVDVSGQLSADALYAAMGDIADLTVDKFSTSRRIVKYLCRDTSDDNYVTALDEKLAFVSGEYAGGTTQARNPNGLKLYWESDPDADDVVLGTDGYPEKNGVRIFTTTSTTSWPVYVYKYNEQVKAKFAFETWGDIYTPVLTMGAGNTSGRNIGYIVKSADGLEIIYKANTGQDIGLRLGTGGYMDLVGLRKPTNIAFTSGGFSVMMDGGLKETYTMTRSGSTIYITDSTGHKTTVTGV